MTGIFFTPAKKLSSDRPDYPQVTFNKRLEGYRTVPSAHPYYRHGFYGRDVRARPELVRRRQQQQPKKVKKEQESQFTPKTAIFSHGGLNTTKTININNSSNNSSNSNSNEKESEMWIGLAAPPVR